MQCFAPIVDSGQVKSTLSGGGSSSGFLAESVAGGYAWKTTGVAADNGSWDFLSFSNCLALRMNNDAYTTTTEVLRVTRSGLAITSVAFGGPVQGTAASGDFSASGSVTSLLASNVGGSTGAVVGFLRSGVYGVKMGIDVSNNFGIGGWSDGNSYRVYWDTAGNQITRGGVYANGVLLSSARALKNIVGDVPAEAAFHRVMSWLPKLYSRKDEASPRVRAGLILDEMPPEITDRDGHIDLYAALTELAAAFQFLARKVTGEPHGD